MQVISLPGKFPVSATLFKTDFQSVQNTNKPSESCFKD